jgi:hypothetical protein
MHYESFEKRALAAIAKRVLPALTKGFKKRPRAARAPLSPLRSASSGSPAIASVKRTATAARGMAKGVVDKVTPSLKAGVATTGRAARGTVRAGRAAATKAAPALRVGASAVKGGVSAASKVLPAMKRGAATAINRGASVAGRATKNVATKTTKNAIKGGTAIAKAAPGAPRKVARAVLPGRLATGVGLGATGYIAGNSGNKSQ